MFIPFTQQYEYVKEFKQAPRRDDDIAIVNAGMRVRLVKAGAGVTNQDDVMEVSHMLQPELWIGDGLPCVPSYCADYVC